MKFVFILLLSTILNAQWVIKDTVDNCYSAVLINVSEDSLAGYADYYQVDAQMDSDSREILLTHQMQYYHLIAREERTFWTWTYYVTVWEGDLAIAIFISDTTCLGELKWIEAVKNLRIKR